MDPHQILGVSKGATLDQIREAYRKMSRKYHPDAGGDDWAFIQVQNAYRVLISQFSSSKGQSEGQDREPPGYANQQNHAGRSAEGQPGSRRGQNREEGTSSVLFATKLEYAEATWDLWMSGKCDNLFNVFDINVKFLHCIGMDHEYLHVKRWDKKKFISRIVKVAEWFAKHEMPILKGEAHVDGNDIKDTLSTYLLTSYRLILMKPHVLILPLYSIESYSYSCWTAFDESVKLVGRSGKAFEWKHIMTLKEGFSPCEQHFPLAKFVLNAKSLSEWVHASPQALAELAENSTGGFS